MGIKITHEENTLTRAFVNKYKISIHILNKNIKQMYKKIQSENLEIYNLFMYKYQLKTGK